MSKQDRAGWLAHKKDHRIRDALTVAHRKSKNERAVHHDGGSEGNTRLLAAMFAHAAADMNKRELAATLDSTLWFASSKCAKWCAVSGINQAAMLRDNGWILAARRLLAGDVRLTDEQRDLLLVGLAKVDL